MFESTSCVKAVQAAPELTPKELVSGWPTEVDRSQSRPIQPSSPAAERKTARRRGILAPRSPPESGKPLAHRPLSTTNGPPAGSPEAEYLNFQDRHDRGNGSSQI